MITEAIISAVSYGLCESVEVQDQVEIQNQNLIYDQTFSFLLRLMKFVTKRVDNIFYHALVGVDFFRRSSFCTMNGSARGRRQNFFRAFYVESGDNKI